MRNKLIATTGLALLVVSGAVAETTPAPAAAYPYAYVNPFDPNWWLATLNSMAMLYSVPGSTGYVAPAAPPAAGSPAPTAAYPYGYVNPFDPTWWLAGLGSMANAYAAPGSAGNAAQGGTANVAPAAGSAYVPVQTPYGPVQVFNFADPMAWNKLLAQPFAPPAQTAATR
jgi:hypothetical protein